MRGLMYLMRVAAATKRVLLVYHTLPIHIEEVMEPTGA